MAIRIARKKIIITAIVVVVLLGGGGAYAYYAGYFTAPAKDTSTGTTDPTKTSTTYKKSLNQNQTQVTTLVTAGDEKSIQQATAIVDSQIASADRSGNDSYSVDAYLAKASLYIDTNRSQEAIDTILTPLDQKYGDNESYKYNIYGYFSRAYEVLGNTEKSAEYFNKIPVKGFD
ncbi:MAG: hypothetical protein ABIP50_00310 [Candidatus Saccharimonadales bacterium]